MRISIDYIDDVAIVRPDGKITIGSGDVELQDTVIKLVLRGKPKVLLVLAGVTTVDSSGLHELVAMYMKIYNAGGHVVLVDVPAKVRDILEITQLITIFDIADTIDEGLALLKSSPKI